MGRRSLPTEQNLPAESCHKLSENDPNSFPLLVAFDLDYTLWDLWIDTHIVPPLKRLGDLLNQLVDRRGQNLSFYPEVPLVLAELKRRRIHIAAASRTSAPELAREALSLLLLEGEEGGDHMKALSYFNTLEIYPGSKLRHFREIHRKTGIPYSQMLFFDDEHRNFEVEALGVTMQLVPHTGTDRRLWGEGLAKWRKRRGIITYKE
ncbi:magnesium-dependent phosphatase-1 [Cryptococcus depauperatus CBS 7841]|uniref:Magnesium-dependent phosphatase-1 n=1 Tax=Cryptococcus depauperatus CBS 7841 TaxID=1295531 RepID=A0AAJ8JRK4_9TREE